MTPLDVASMAGNLITSGALAIAGIAALSIAFARRETLPPLLAGVIGVSLIVLATDEGVDLHEHVGLWLYEERGIEAPGPINHVDDLFITAYVAFGAVIGVLALPSLVRTRALFASMIVVGTMFVLAAALDALGTPGSWTDVPEEALEACGAGALAIIFAREAGILAWRAGAIPATRPATPSPH